jgi:DNA-binding CsgD family transcriptional regulator
VVDSELPGGDPWELGKLALASGDWKSARAHFEAAIRRQESAPALEGLADALYWLDEIGPSLDRRARAYAIYREAGDLCRAARAALWLAMGYASAYGDVAVANGWLQRTQRLLAETGPCVERGWFEHLRGKMSPDAATTVHHARLAVDIARRHGDADLELWALSEQGRALVSLGRVDEGMAMLDEAVVAATAGEAHDLLVVGNTCCNMLSACDRAVDFVRAVQWCRVVDDFARRHQHLPIFHYCRSVYSGVLVATGRWDEAENELTAALRAIEQKYPAEKVHSLGRLALLYVRRGRLEEAAQLLSAVEHHALAAEASAALQLARGEWGLAAALLERRLGVTGDGLPAVPLLGLLVEATLALGNVDEAHTAAARISAIAARAGRPPIEAMALLAAGRVETARGAAARGLLERACAQFEQSGMPFEAAVARLDCARALAASEHELAAEDARAALSVFEGLGARPYADRAASLLRDLGRGSAPRPRTAEDLTRREREVLDLVSHGLANADIAGRLFISAKTVEHHVGRILSKLGLRNRAEAAAWALRNPSAGSGRK